jgi:arylsulfatase
MNRRQFLTSTIGAAAALVLENGAGAQNAAPARKPNIILILADDLGFGELGCYGQKKIPTPNIDRLAAEGMKFTTFYSGAPVCAPARCVLLTGKHTGHCAVRDNHEIKPEGQWPLPPKTVTLAGLLKQAGYTTACIGKWGLGGPESTGQPNKQGFDYFYGHICQRLAHDHFPEHLWRNTRREIVEGNDPNSFTGTQYAPDMMADDALRWIRQNKDRPFFLYFATPLTHLALQAPADAVAKFDGKWPETPYDGTKSYLPNDRPRSTYAAMVDKLDQHVGKVLDLIKELGLDDNTIFLFTSDNGAAFDIGGADSAFFESTGGLRDFKGSVYDGGLRVPLLARWPGKIKAGAVTDQLGAFEDFLPTLCEIAGAGTPADTDGLSLVPTLLGAGTQKRHEYLYWENHAYGGKQAVRLGKWKGLRVKVKEVKDAPLELYDLEADPAEKNDVAAANPQIVQKILAIMKSARTRSNRLEWNIPA